MSVCKSDPFAGQAIHVVGVDFGFWIIAGHVPVSHVISHYEDDVRFFHLSFHPLLIYKELPLSQNDDDIWLFDHAFRSHLIFSPNDITFLLIHA